MKVNTKDIQIYGESFMEQGIRVFTMIGKEGVYTVVNVREEEVYELANSLYDENVDEEYIYEGVRLVFKYRGLKLEDIKRGDYEVGFKEHVDLINNVLSNLGVEEGISLRDFVNCVAYQAIGVLKNAKRKGGKL